MSDVGPTANALRDNRLIVWAVEPFLDTCRGIGIKLIGRLDSPVLRTSAPVAIHVSASKGHPTLPWRPGALSSRRRAARMAAACEETAKFDRWFDEPTSAPGVSSGPLSLVADAHSPLLYMRSAHSLT